MCCASSQLAVIFNYGCLWLNMHCTADIQGEADKLACFCSQTRSCAKIPGCLDIKSRNTWMLCVPCLWEWVYKRWLQRRWPVETCERRLNSGKRESWDRKREIENLLNKVREEEWENSVRAAVKGFSPTGKQGLSQDAAQVSAGPGEAVISCTWCVWALHLLGDFLKHSCSPSAWNRPVR